MWYFIGKISWYINFRIWSKILKTILTIDNNKKFIYRIILYGSISNSVDITFNLPKNNITNIKIMWNSEMYHKALKLIGCKHNY